MQLDPLQQKSESPWIFGIGFVIALVTAGAILFSLFVWVFRSTSIPPQPEPALQPVVQQVPRALDGVVVGEDQAHNRPVAVVIDNMEEARPIIGLSTASIVVETPVEGGITRYLAIYDPAFIPDSVGPVRSLRPYFLDLAQSLDALLLHVGGSPEALELARTAPVDRLNQFYDPYFWRSTEREAPFNVFTSRMLVERAFGDRSIRRVSTLVNGVFADEAPSTAPTHTRLSIPGATDPYDVQWEWDVVSGTYRRFMGGAPFFSDDRQVGAKNVIVQWVPMEILDEVGRRRITTTGSGRAMIARNGKTIEGTWKREAGQRTKYVDVQGNEIALAPGATWIEMVRDTLTVTVE